MAMTDDRAVQSSSMVFVHSSIIVVETREGLAVSHGHQRSWCELREAPLMWSFWCHGYDHDGKGFI
jgi:hypothetical protein